MKPTNFGGRWWLFSVVVFSGFLQKDHNLDNQAINQNCGLIN
jgi:hypothetical protein